MFIYKGKRCFIRPIHKADFGFSSWSPGSPYVCQYTVIGPGFTAWSVGIGHTFARKAKDARQTLQDAIDKAVR